MRRRALLVAMMLGASCKAPDPGRHLLVVTTADGVSVLDERGRAFGRGRPGVHSLALSPDGGRLTAIHSLSATFADIDPDRLAIKETGRFASAPQDGKPGIGFTRDGALVVSVDGKVIITKPHRELATPGEPRGLVIGPGHDGIWAGHPDGVVRFDPSKGPPGDAAIQRIPIPGLYVLKHVLRTTGPHEPPIFPQNRSAATLQAVAASSI